ncbi:MAG: hypothetical protein Q8868_02650, partial [Bacteroidota bacterium]|nr:hypothetical protein [Bacteroidota bacterium]
MKKSIIIVLAILSACTSPKTVKVSDKGTAFINETTISAAIDSVKASYPAVNAALLDKGIRHAASLWKVEDGTPAEFAAFVKKNYIANPEKRKEVFNKITNYFESLNGNFNEITIDLKKNLDEATGAIDEVDRMFGNYSVSSHMSDDFYANKIAFLVALNFPYYTLEEKEKLGPDWGREDWAMARLGDYFFSRVPANLIQGLNTAIGNAEMYISEYNICMGHLRTDDGKQLFPDDMVLLSHWNLRDELKADYADKEKGQEKQEMIYKVMEHIIAQDIPKVVINNPGYEWAPFSNKVSKNGSPVDAASEPDARYGHIVDIFRAMMEIDPYSEAMNTAILRKFSVEMEIAQEEVEALFDSYMSSPQLAKVGALIRKKLGRDLRPYDIWYTGFKTQSTIPENQLTARTESLYPDAAAFKAGMPVLLEKL